MWFSTGYQRWIGSFICAVILAAIVVVWTNAPTPENSTEGNQQLATSSIGVTNSFGTTTGQMVSSSTSSGTTTANLLQGMTMTFDDEFNSFSRYADATGNTTCTSGGSGTWQTVYDFCSRTNASNDEAEVYIDPSFLAFLKKESIASGTADAENPFSIQDGILSITAAPSSQQILSAVGPWAKYTSGMITTQFSFSQEYGYFEMRAKLPAGKGLWPAFWLLPEDETWPPEIDALEAFGDPSSTKEGGRTMIHYGSHALVAGESCGGWYNTGVDITQAFHTYGVDIEPTGITYYFDGTAYATCPKNSATNKPFYMIINLAVGGTGSWPSTPNASNVWPATLSVDYVRAYQKK